MGLKYFFSLYWRNMKGAFWKGWVSSDLDYAAPFIWLGHLIALPLTLILGAGLKTIIDYSTRKYTPQDEVTTVQSSIENMKEEEMGSLISELESQGYYARSNSSAMLFSQLSTDAQYKEDRAAKRIEWKKKHREYALSELDVEPGTEHKVYQESYLDNYRVNDWYQAKLDTIRIVKVGFESSKAKLSEFMKDENNNGKKLFQLVVGFFNKKAEETKSQVDNGTEVAHESTLPNNP